VDEFDSVSHRQCICRSGDSPNYLTIIVILYDMGNSRVDTQGRVVPKNNVDCGN